MTFEGFVPDQRISGDVSAFLADHESKSMLRFITCGSVDDGKSTLIGRLLYDSRMIYDDQLAALEQDSRKVGTQGGAIDFALLVDGLAAEREQGITIDVAYRFFVTEKRKFIVADTPGHEQYTRNMVTGASTAELAVILVDARQGVLTQTRRHSYIVHLMGIRHIVLAVNKMDLVGYDERKFKEIVEDYRAFASSIGINEFVPVPISGLMGDNITRASVNMPWYHGRTLMNHLETVPLDSEHLSRRPFRMPVQWVNRPHLDFRGFAGQVSAGCIARDDAVRIVPSGVVSTVRRIVGPEGDLTRAVAGQSVTIVLKDEVDCSRGSVLAALDHPPESADLFEVTLVWMDEVNLLPGRSYLLKLGAQSVSVTVQHPKYRIDVNSRERLATKTFALNDIGVVEISTSKPLVFEPYRGSDENINADLGGFILIDKSTNRTVAAGMIHFALRRSHNIHWQAIEISREAHSRQKGQRACVLWFTGLSGSGKSTIANLVEKRLFALGRHTFLLDGDNIRHGLSRDLGFGDADRIENIRRVGEVAKLMADAGLIVLTAFISPFRAEREMVRQMIPAGEFLEVFIDTPLSVAELRDVKGLYKKARKGDLVNFTGIDSPYEPPESADIIINTLELTAEQAADVIVQRLMANA